MQRAALAAALLALTLALPLAYASPDQVTVTVTYEVWGGYTGDYTPLDYTTWGTTGWLTLAYPVDARARLRAERDGQRPLLPSDRGTGRWRARAWTTTPSSTVSSRR